MMLLPIWSVTLFAQGNKKIDSLLAVLQIAKEDSNKVKILDELAFQYWNAKNATKAIDYGKSSLSLAKKINDKKGEAFAYSHLSTILQTSHNGSDNLSIEYSLAAIRLFNELGDKKSVAREYLSIGITYCNQNDYTEGIKHYINSLKVYESIGEKYDIAMATGQVGNVYLKSDNFPEALSYLNKASKIFEQIGEKERVAMCQERMQNACWKQGNYAQALEYSLAAIKIREERKDKKKMAEGYNSIGLIYRSKKNYDEALKYFNSALKIRQEINDKNGIGLVYGNLGTVFSDQGNHQDALKYLGYALKIFDETGYRIGIASCYNNIGDEYKEMKNYEEAKKNYLAALKIREEIKDKNGLTSSYINLGSLHIKLNNLPEAKKYLDDALLLSKELGKKESIKLSYQVLAELDSTQHNFKSAYENYKSYISYRDSIENKENTEKITRLGMQHEFGKKEDSLKYQQTLTDEKLKQQTLLAQQKEQSLLLKGKELALANKDKEVQRLAYLQAQSELEIEQVKRTENEKQLLINSQEKSLQQTRLDLQASQLRLQDKDLQAKRTQRNIFIAGTFGLLLLSFFIYRNFQNQRKANKLIQVSAGKQNAELQLQSLRAQLNPHFMFNSLNAIQELILMEENEKSQSYLERFAQLLRILLENADQPFISLRKEINFLELYLSLEKLRIPDMQYLIKVDPSIDAEKAMTPNMMLQPYIENALWHGLSHKQGEKKLELHVSRQNGSLQYAIKDNGVGRKKASELKTLYRKEHKSKGMELLSKRFNLLSKEYGEDIQVRITDLTENGEASGTLFSISVPDVLQVQHQKSLL